MTYSLDIDPDAQDQIRALPPVALDALAEAFEVLSLVPERGRPLNPDNPDGGLFQLTFGDGRGLITYLLLTFQDRVDVLVVTWVSFEHPPGI
ncbi:hypothetical protein GCM10022243_67350 [Saccharothrix violaceirubra]|uniref:Plasmid stabilization system protein ParE n=1 Tax=Saccharothrix violaceirubra TaxID=413306 RepID=A0A7W7WW90_9PSEU|nr:hypothetical protein [Saccharothrix violaceirubra]MBB4965313.1 plasmid stabilization system protein ParE [Saccharothrix violaceirubra]